MLRIVGGLARGIRLAPPPSRCVRPPTDRMRASLFTVLEPCLRDARVLDAFAGTGVVGLEALSRGVPVVCLDHQGPGDIVTGDCGVKIPVTTPAQVSQDLRQSADWAKIKENAKNQLRDERNLAAAELFRLTGDEPWQRIFLETTKFTDAKADLAVWQSHDQREAVWVYLRTQRPGLSEDVLRNCRAALLRDMPERAHDAPDCAEQPEKRSTTDRDGQQENPERPLQPDPGDLLGQHRPQQAAEESSLGEHRQAAHGARAHDRFHRRFYIMNTKDICAFHQCNGIKDSRSVERL